MGSAAPNLAGGQVRYQSVVHRFPVDKQEAPASIVAGQGPVAHPGRFELPTF